MKKRTHYFITIIVLGMMIVFNGCKIGQNYVRPVVDSPEKFGLNNDTTASTTIDWWTLFNNSELDTLIRIALENNHNLLQAARSVEQANFQLSIQKLNLLPQFSANGSATRGNYLGAKTDNINNGFVIGAQASWDLDFWGKYRRLSESARAQLLASEYGLASIQIELVASVARTYFQLLEYRESLYISQSTLSLRDSTLRVIKQRFDAGLVPEIDLNSAQIQRAAAAGSIPKYRILVQNTEGALAMLLGRYPGSFQVGGKMVEMTTPPEIPAGLPSQLLERRPDVLFAEQQLVAQNAMIGVARSNQLPSISLTGFLGGASSQLSDLTGNGIAWNAGGAILAPLFNWRQYANKVKVEKSKYEASVLAYQQAALQAFIDVENSLNEVANLKLQQSAVEEQAIAAMKTLKLASDRYDKGVASYIEYLDAQRQSYDAQLALANIRQQVLTAYVKLYQALGGGWSI